MLLLPCIQALLQSSETRDTYTGVQTLHKKRQKTMGSILHITHYIFSYRCQGVCQLVSSPGLLFPAGLGEKPSSEDLACPRPARGNCWTGVSEWWRRGWAGCLVLGCCSLPSPWSQYCCRWHRQTAWCPSSPRLQTAKHLRQSRRVTERGGKRNHGEISWHEVNDL